jgi:electron transfer flavoprotein alpha subunit
VSGGEADVWAVLPGGVEQPPRVTAELVGEAKRLGAEVGGEAVAAVVEPSASEATPEELASWGASRVLLCRGSDLDSFHPERVAAALAAAIGAKSPRAVLFPGTSIGTDLGVRTSLHVKRRFASGCVDFSIAADQLRVTRPLPGGALHATEIITEAPYLMSLIPDTVGTEAPEAGRAAELEEFTCPPLPTPGLRDCGRTPGDPKTMDVVDAEVIVAGGRGLGGADAFALVEHAAELIGGCVAASRPAVEAGWAPYERQVGQTGRTVTPKLYIACAISGATQHLAGMREAKTIITINNDAEAPINSIAKLAVVGDAREVLEALVRALEERTSPRAAA